MRKLEQVTILDMLGAHDPEIWAVPSGELALAQTGFQVLIDKYFQEQVCPSAHFTLVA